MARRVRLDPKRTSVHGHKLNEKAVAFYEEKPNGRYQGGGGRVIGQKQSDGSVVILNGAHRRQAARNTGRKLEVELYEVGEKLPKVESGCALVVLATIGTLAGIAYAVREVLPV